MVQLSTQAQNSLSNLKVLFVDDSDDERELFSMRLLQYGADVSTASSAEEAIDEISQGATDVLVFGGGAGVALRASCDRAP